MDGVGFRIGFGRLCCPFRSEGYDHNFAWAFFSACWRRILCGWTWKRPLTFSLRSPPRRCMFRCWNRLLIDLFVLTLESPFWHGWWKYGFFSSRLLWRWGQLVGVRRMRGGFRPQGNGHGFGWSFAFAAHRWPYCWRNRCFRGLLLLWLRVGAHGRGTEVRGAGRYEGRFHAGHSSGSPFADCRCLISTVVFIHHVNGGVDRFCIFGRGG